MIDDSSSKGPLVICLADDLLRSHRTEHVVLQLVSRVDDESRLMKLRLAGSLRVESHMIFLKDHMESLSYLAP